MQDVAIFWDYENCPSPSNASGCVVANSIRLMAQPYGRIKSFKAYLAITDQYTVARAVTLRSEFQASGVSLIDCPHNGRKEVADKMIIVDMLTHAIDNPAPSTIILITGDRDFAYPMSILRLRQYEVILVTLSNAHFTLTAQASKCVDWFNDVLSSSAQPVGSSGGAVSGPTLVRCEIAPPTHTVSSQSVQTVQEDDSEDPKKQINLLQYLRAASSTHYKRPSVSSSNYRSSHLGDPRQDTSPIIDVDLSPDGSSDNDQTPISTTEIVHPKEVDLSFSSQGITTEPSSGPTETDKPFGPGNQTPHHANSVDEPNTLKAPLSFTTFPPKIDEPSPYTPISTSVLQVGQPPVILENDESDIHPDDSDAEPNFIYPIRPASAPDTLPSPNPLAVSMVDNSSILLDVPSTINDPEEGTRTVTSVNENENQDNASQLAMLKEEINGYSSFSFAARPTVNPPGPVSIVSPFMSPVSPHIRPSPASALSPLAPAFDISNFSTPTYPGFTLDKIHHFHNVKSESSMPQSLNTFTPSASFTPNAGATVPAWYSRVSISRDPLQSNFNSPPPKFGSFTPPIGTSAPPLASSKSGDEISLPPVVPSIFKILVRVLQTHKEKGQIRPTRSKVAVEISMNRTTYKKAGVGKFWQYTELAEQQGIIELGMKGSEAWIALRPAWWNADAT